MSGELTTNENALKEQLIDLVRSVAEPLNAEISRLQQELSDCKSSLRAVEAKLETAQRHVEWWQEAATTSSEQRNRAEAAEQKFEAASEAYENLQFDAGAERQRANAAEAREKQVRAALEPFDKLGRELFMRNWNASDVVFQSCDHDFAIIKAGDFFNLRRALGQTEPGEQA